MDRTELEALKARVDLAEVFRLAGLPLRRVGRNLMVRCPFHEDGEASLSVNPETRLWNCFGCEAGGDVLTFLQLREGLEFPQAVERLRELAGASAPAPPAPAPRPAEEPLPGGVARAELLGRVAELYARRFREVPQAQDYLRGRGLGSRELWDAFRVGYADGSLLSTLPKEGPVREALVRLGVLNEKGREHFRGCLVVPLEHPDHGVVGLYGRRLDAEAQVRHLFLPGPRLGVLHWQALKVSQRLVLAEGVLDALSLWQAGVREVSCLHGLQGLPVDLEELLGRFGVREVVLCLDGDAAGREAGPRLAGALADRGLRVLAAELPDGCDPNAMLTGPGPEALQAAVRGARAAGPAPEAPASRPAREETGDGFTLRLADTTYRVTPRPPFSGRLRVTLRASRDGRLALDTADLYSHRSRTGLANQFSRRLELPKTEVERHLSTLLEESEAWIAALEEEAGEDPGARAEAPPMTAEEREAALDFLRAPELVERLLADMEALGYVGEEKGKLLAYLIGLSRKLERPLSGIVLSQSGAGKSSLTELVEQVTPPEDVVLYSRISAQALGYLPKDFLKRKLLILEERVGGEAADYHIRVLQSRQKLSQAVVVKDPATGKMHTRHFEVEGPIAYLETTTNPRLNHENATRCFEIPLDETAEQTRRIQERQRRSRALEGARRLDEAEAIRRRHHDAQRLLERVAVFVPFVHLLSFPTQWLRTRRDHERFLCLLEAVTFLHQHQREGGVAPDGTRFVLATTADYRLAFDLARDVLAATFHELSRAGRELWDAVRDWLQLQGSSDVVFTRRDMRAHTRWQDHRLREGLAELVEMEYLAVLNGSQGRAFQYRLLVQAEGEDGAPMRELTTPDQLEERWKGGNGRHH